MLSRDLVSRLHLRALLAGICAATCILLLSGAPAQAAITHLYTGTSFGPDGVGSGSFGRAVAVAVAQSSGDVFVLDASEGGRVYKFNATGEPVDFSSSGTDKIEGVGSAGGSEEELAVDDSSGPDAGDIYVANNQTVRIYAASGTFLGELSGGEMCGVAVDPSGNVYVGVYPATIKRYTPTVNPVTNANESASMGGLSAICNVAVDASGDVYAATYYGGVNKYDALQFGSLTATGELVDAHGRTLAIDPSSGEVFIDEENQIAQFEGSAEPPKPLGTAGSAGQGALSESFGVGVDHTSGDLYAADGERVEIFGPGVVIASATTEAASGVSNSAATLHGSVQPAGTEVTSCVFEYGAQVGALNQTAPCEPATPYTGTTPVAVTAQLKGLSRGAAYSYRLAASNASGTAHGAEETFQTDGAPTLETTQVSQRGQHSVRISTSINPHALDTHYHIEYGTGNGYGSSTPSVDLGMRSASDETEITGLTLDSTYHFRVVATNSEGSVESADQTFTTESVASISEIAIGEIKTTSAKLSAEVDDYKAPVTYHFEYGTTTGYGSVTPSTALAGSENWLSVEATLTGLSQNTTYHLRLVVEGGSETVKSSDITLTTESVTAGALTLPDERGYEKVSPNNNADGDVYQDNPLVLALQGGWTEQPFVVAEDGEAVAYMGDPSEHGGGGAEGAANGNQYVARRLANGAWSATNVEPPIGNLNTSAIYTGFSPDLSVGFLDWYGASPLAEGAPTGEFSVLYAKTFSTGLYEPLVKTGPPHRAAGQFGAFGVLNHEGLSVAYAGSSANLSHELFMANDTLTSNAVDGGVEANNLYDSSEGATTLVNVLPNGSTEANATFGGPSLEGPEHNEPMLAHDISADGSRIFWTDLKTHDLYVREHDTAPQSPVAGGVCTVPADACTVLIAEEAQFWDATPAGSKVLYTKGGDLYEDDLEDGQTTDLAPNGNLDGVVASSENLAYVYFVANAALAPGAAPVSCEQAADSINGTRCNLYAVHAGEPIRFVGALTQFDNHSIPESSYASTDGDWQGSLGAREAEVTPDGTHLLFTSQAHLTGYESASSLQVFMYDFVSGQLACLSCKPSGEAVDSDGFAYLPVSRVGTVQPHWMSADGNRVFFDSASALVPQDINRHTDVYEWERDSSGSCTQSPGCIYMLSDGAAAEGSYLVGASASGDDVFITTRSKLVAEDENENIDLYDVRVGGGKSLVAPQCTGAGCQGVPSAPPIFATPPSVTYNGVGNFEQATPVVVAKSKPLTRTQKLAQALRTCRRSSKKRRAACERQARKRYGAQSQKGPSLKKRGFVKRSSGRDK
jgi:hypothetical protein